MRPLLLLIGLLLPGVSSSAAQDSAPGLSAPTQAQRLAARDQLGDKLLGTYRRVLREGGPTPLVLDALIELGRNRAAGDIALIARQVSALDPAVSTTALEALKGYGRAGLRAVAALDASLIDAQTRRQATDLLLTEHVRNCCRRDMSVNPYQLEYATRFDELRSVELPLEDLLLRMLRDSLPDIRADLEGTRYYSGFYGGRYEQPFVDFGALAVAALAASNPAVLEREFAELTRLSQQPPSWYWGGQRTPVTMEFAVFFARRGQPALADRVINDIQQMARWNDMTRNAQYQVQVAMLQSRALNEHSAAVERLGNAIDSLGSGPESGAAWALYLRARLLLQVGEEGAALQSLEEAMESTSAPPVICLVDDAFTQLAGERRYRDVLRYCELRQRALSANVRPWRPGEPEPEAEGPPEEDDPVEDD